MTPLATAVERVVSTFSAVLHVAGDGSPDLAAFQRLLRDPKDGLTQEENAAIQATDETRLATEIEAELLQRRLSGHWPHGAVRRPN